MPSTLLNIIDLVADYKQVLREHALSPQWCPHHINCKGYPSSGGKSQRRHLLLLHRLSSFPSGLNLHRTRQHCSHARRCLLPCLQHVWHQQPHLQPRPRWHLCLRLHLHEVRSPDHDRPVVDPPLRSDHDRRLHRNLHPNCKHGSSSTHLPDDILHLWILHRCCSPSSTGSLDPIMFFCIKWKLFQEFWCLLTLPVYLCTIPSM